MADHTIDIVIQMLARGDGAKVTQEQIREINRLAHETGEKGNQARDVLLSMSAAGVALAGAFKLAAAGVREFSEMQEAVVALDAALALQGNLVDEVREKYHALAAEQENATNIAGDRWVQAMATLTKFGAQPAEIEKYTDAVKNLAGYMGDGIESAAFTFGKAISGNVDILKRYGIEVDENSSKQEKLNQIMEQLAQRGGGQLEARAGTLKGGFAGLREATNNVLEGIGNLIDRTHVLSIGLHVLTGIARGLAMMLPSTVEQSAQLNNKFKDLSQSAGEAGEAAEAAQQRMKTAVDQTNDSLKAQLGDLQRIRQFHDSLNDEETGAKLAQVDMDEAQGNLPPHEATARRAEIRRNAQARKISEENIATVKARDALLGQRVGASEATDSAGAAADTADANVAAFAKSIGVEDLGSLPSRFGKLSNERKKASPERQEEIDQQLAGFAKLNQMMSTAKEAETKYQDSLAQQKKIWDGTVDALKSVNDQLAIIEAKWNRLDESQYAFAQSERIYSRPVLVDWIQTSLLNNNVPVALIASPLFSKRLHQAEKQTIWNSDQFKRRIFRYEILPPKPTRADIELVMKHHLPDGEAAARKFLAGYAATAAHPFTAIADTLADAALLARAAGRARVAIKDMMEAVGTFRASSELAKRQAFAPAPGKGSRTRAAQPLQATGSDPAAEMQEAIEETSKETNFTGRSRSVAATELPTVRETGAALLEA